MARKPPLMQRSLCQSGCQRCESSKMPRVTEVGPVRRYPRFPKIFLRWRVEPWIGEWTRGRAVSDKFAALRGSRERGRQLGRPRCAVGAPRRHSARRGLRDQREIRSRLIDSAVRDERTRRRRLHSNVVDLFHLRRLVPGICLIHAVEGEDDKALGGAPVKRGDFLGADDELNAVLLVCLFR